MSVAHSLSAQKRVRQNEKQRMYNRSAKSELKTEMKNFLELIHDKKVDEARAALPKAYKEIDQVAGKGVIHQNTAARRKARLAKALNTLEQAQA